MPPRHRRIETPSLKHLAGVVLAAVLMGPGCATATLMGDDEDVLPEADAASVVVDARIIFDAEPLVPDASIDAAPVPVTTTLQASFSNTIEDQNSVSCGTGSNHRDNRYMRIYSLMEAGITTDFEVEAVHVGIETAASASATQPIDVRVHLLGGPMAIANLTQLASVTVQVPPQTGSILNVPIAATIPAGATMVVEVHTPDGVDVNNSFFIGSNQLSETSPSYLVSADCSNPEPTPAANLVPGLLMSMVLNVTGVHTTPQ